MLIILIQRKNVMKKFQQLYEGYIDSTYNQNLIKKILELDVIQNESQLLRP